MTVALQKAAAASAGPAPERGLGAPLLGAFEEVSRRLSGLRMDPRPWVDRDATVIGPGA
jgi:hypothetical protein